MYTIQTYTTEPSPRRVRTYFNGEAVADSKNMVLFFEPPYPAYYFPKTDVRMDLLEESAKRIGNDPRGEKVFWNLKVGDRRAENAAFTYRNPPNSDQADLDEYLTFNWLSMDNWFEEDEEIYVHPRNPYKRIDTVQSSRHVEVSVDGTKVADTRRPLLLWETGLPTRYYIPREDVRLDLMDRTETVTRCPYKGIAETFAVKIGDSIHKDFAWSYPDPIPECPKIKGLVCFYNEVVDIVEDGIAIERPETIFK